MTNIHAIKCLGKTFASEDERREHFRNELRKKLPELKKIEGFPIGEDEDIIALSDPPYYTACPNPWLNDFIAEWEKEKETIPSHKKNFKLNEPYASDISEGKNNPIYNAHSYHTKVPHPAIMRYILHYTQPGDVVFDGFAGTGMTGVAAKQCGNTTNDLKYRIEEEWKKLFNSSLSWGGRNAICGDLSTIASFIAYNYNTDVNPFKMAEEVESVTLQAEKEYSWMFETIHSKDKKGKIIYIVWSDVFTCSCGFELIYFDLAYDAHNGVLKELISCPKCRKTSKKDDLERCWVTRYDDILDKTIRIIKTVPVQINYTFQGSRFNKKPGKFDFDVLSRIDDIKPFDFVPIKRMPEGDESRRNDRIGITHVHQFYTKRNLLILSFLWARLPIEAKWTLTNFLSRNLLKCNRFVVNKYNPTGRINGPMSGTLYIPSESVEQSAFELLKDKLIKIELHNQGNAVQVASATDLNMLANNSIDYIFTDPPFGSNIMYSELNFIPESWLKLKTNIRNEAIENKTQQKSTLTYQDIMTKCFREYFRILKPGKWMTVEFSNTSAAVWNGIQTALQRAGFVVANVSALDKKHGGFRAMYYAVAVKEDLVISCYKPSSDFEMTFLKKQTDKGIWNFIKEHLEHLPIYATDDNKKIGVIERSPKILYDRLITFYLMRGMPVPIDAGDFQTIMKQKFLERDGMYFTVEQAALYDKLKPQHEKNGQLSLVFDIIYSENDAVQWLKDRLSKTYLKYNEIQPDFIKANVATRKGEREIELKTVLDENFIQETSGRWRVPDMNEAKDREALRTKALLKEFDRYIAELSNAKTKKLKEVRVEALRAGFKSCWEKKDFNTIVTMGDKIPQNLLLEDEQLLMFYDIAKDRI